jgi:hypothetical protein
VTVATMPLPDPPFTGHQLVRAVKAALRGERWTSGMSESQVTWLAQVMPGAVRYSRLMDRFAEGDLDGADLEELLALEEW